MGPPQAAVVVVVLVQKREVLDERGRALVVVLSGRAEVMLTGLDQAGVVLDERVEVVLCEQAEEVLLVVLTQRGDVVLVVSGTAVTMTTKVEVEVTGMVVVVERVVLAQRRDVVLVVAGTAVTMTTEVEVEVTETVAEVESVLFLEKVWLGRRPLDRDGGEKGLPVRSNAARSRRRRPVRLNRHVAAGIVHPNSLGLNNILDLDGRGSSRGCRSCHWTIHASHGRDSDEHLLGDCGASRDGSGHLQSSQAGADVVETVGHCGGLVGGSRQ